MTTDTAASDSASLADSRADAPFIVVGFDGSDSAHLAVERGLRLAHALHTRLRVVTTWTYPISYGGFPIPGWSPEEDARHLLKDAVDELFPDGAPAWFEAVTVEGTPARVLISESRGAEMLVVGSRGHGGFTGLLLGSVSSACAEHAECPVLVMHSSETASAGSGAGSGSDSAATLVDPAPAPSVR